MRWFDCVRDFNLKMHAFRSQSMHSTYSSAINHAMHFALPALPLQRELSPISGGARGVENATTCSPDPYLTSAIAVDFPTVNEYIHRAQISMNFNWSAYFLRAIRMCNFRCNCSMFPTQTRGGWPHENRSNCIDTEFKVEKKIFMSRIYDVVEGADLRLYGAGIHTSNTLGERKFMQP